MKKLTLTLAMAMAVCAAFAAPEKFLGWKTTDTAAIKAQLAKANDSVPVHHKVLYTYMLAKLEAPDTVDTLAKIEAAIDAAKAQFKIETPTTQIVLGVLRNSWDKRFLDDLAKNEKYTNEIYYKTHYVVLGFAQRPDAEVKAVAFEAARYLCGQTRCQPVTAKVIDRFIQLGAADDDETVIKELKVLYRLVLPKLTAAADDPWKPVAAKLQLALKSRGAEVK